METLKTNASKPKKLLNNGGILIMLIEENKCFNQGFRYIHLIDLKIQRVEKRL